MRHGGRGRDVAKRGGAIMVRKFVFGFKRSALSLLALAFLSALLLAFTWGGDAQAKGIRGADTVLDEELTIEIDALGNAHYVDVLKYDRSWFNSYAYIFEKYPFLLSRRYRSESNIRDTENFSAQVDRANFAITVTFDTKGEVYNMGDYWILFGFPEKPKFEREGELIFESEGSMNNEYTLYDTMHVNTTTIVKLPPGAKNAKYNESKKGVTYELPYVAPPTSSSVLASNKALFTALFLALMLGSLATGVFVLLRGKGIRPMPAPAVPTYPAGTTPTPPQASTPPTTVPPAPSVSPPPIEAEAGYCKFCGEKLKHKDAKFCSHCGKSLI